MQNDLNCFNASLISGFSTESGARSGNFCEVTKGVVAGMPALIAGSGEPLVFLHGFMSQKEAFLNQLVFFAKRFKTIAVDMKGFGENSFMPYPYTLSDYVRDFYFLVGTLGGKVNVVAHSFGCRVALKAAAESDKINKLVLVGAAGLKTKKGLKYYSKKAVYRLIGRLFKKEKREKIFFSPDYNMLGDVMKQSFKYVTGELLDEKLKYIKSPVLAVFGENDRQTPPYLAKKIKANITGAETHIMKGCGHFCFAESPREFNFSVNEFL